MPASYWGVLAKIGPYKKTKSDELHLKDRGNNLHYNSAFRRMQPSSLGSETAPPGIQDQSAWLPKIHMGMVESRQKRQPLIGRQSIVNQTSTTDRDRSYFENSENEAILHQKRLNGNDSKVAERYSPIQSKPGAYSTRPVLTPLPSPMSSVHTNTMGTPPVSPMSSIYATPYEMNPPSPSNSGVSGMSGIEYVRSNLGKRRYSQSGHFGFDPISIKKIRRIRITKSKPIQRQNLPKPNLHKGYKNTRQNEALEQMSVRGGSSNERNKAYVKLAKKIKFKFA